MTQADIEKAYTEAVDQLARAVEANRLLTQRLEQQELLLAKARKFEEKGNELAGVVMRLLAPPPPSEEDE